jgi:hypothetical protein
LAPAAIAMSVTAWRYAWIPLSGVYVETYAPRRHTCARGCGTGSPGTENVTLRASMPGTVATFRRRVNL